MKAAALLGFLSFALTASAQLTWERTRAEFFPAPGEPTVVATYAFTNRSAATVEVLELHSSCGCTVPTLEKRRYAPGESGVLTAVFTIESREGLQKKLIGVQTDAGETTLELIAQVPVRLAIEPRMLVFRAGGERTQAVRLKFQRNVPVRDVAIANVGAPFRAELVPVRDGHGYEVRVTAASAPAGEVTATVVVRSVGASGAEYFDSFFLRHLP